MGYVLASDVAAHDWIAINVIPFESSINGLSGYINFISVRHQIMTSKGFIHVGKCLAHVLSDAYGA